MQENCFNYKLSSFQKKELDSNHKQLSISFKAVSSYLKEVYENPIKLENNFIYQMNQKEKDLIFSKKIIKMKI